MGGRMSNNLDRETNSHAFLQHAKINVPVICGAMYPCSNPELVAAVSEAGGIGIIQPISLSYVHGYELRKGIRYIRTLTKKPVGMNALIEQSSKRYHQRMMEWVDIALEEGIRFFVTSLGKPGWVVRRVHAAGGIVYHDVTEAKWAIKGLEGGVDGLIAVNNRAGGHAGNRSMQDLAQELSEYQVPLIAAGGISQASDLNAALQCGYEGVQVGTRFIATPECTASNAYKQAIVMADEDSVVLSERLTGVPVSVIRTPYVERTGTQSGRFARWLLSGQKTKHLMRMVYMLRSLQKLKGSLSSESNEVQYWQAGKSVAGIDKIESVAEIMQDFSQVLSQLEKAT